MNFMEKKRLEWASTENRVKKAAGQAIQFCVRKGWIVKPSACERCGSRYNIDGHHWDYSKPLEVEWLCRSCHKLVHKGKLEK